MSFSARRVVVTETPSQADDRSIARPSVDPTVESWNTLRNNTAGSSTRIGETSTYASLGYIVTGIASVRGAGRWKASWSSTLAVAHVAQDLAVSWNSANDANLAGGRVRRQAEAKPRG